MDGARGGIVNVNVCSAGRGKLKLFCEELTEASMQRTGNGSGGKGKLIEGCNLFLKLGL